MHPFSLYESFYLPIAPLYPWEQSPKGSTTGKWTMVSYSIDYVHCKAHILITVSVVYSWKSVYSMVSILKGHAHLYDCTLSTFCVLTSQFLNLSMVFRYFTAGKILERWTLLMLTTGHVMFPCDSVSADKLEAVPMLFVSGLYHLCFHECVSEW